MTTMAPPPMRFQRRANSLPPLVLLYGTAGIGKTTQAAAFPGAMVMRIEDGLGVLNVPATDLLTRYSDVIGTITDCAELSPGTLVVDSLSALEVLVFAETCARHNKASLEAFGWNKGFDAAMDVWREVIDGFLFLRSRGWCVVMIGHCIVVRFDAPDTESYDRYQLDLHKKTSAAGLIMQRANVIGFMHWETTVRERENGKASSTRGIGTGFRNIGLVECPAYVAKSQYPTPPLIRMDPAGHNLLTALHTAGAVLPITTTTDTPTSADAAQES